MSKLFESFLAGQIAVLMEFAPMFWPTVNSYKRLVDGFWAPVKPTWAIDNRTASFRVIPGSPKSTRLETRCPGADINPYLAVAALLAAGLHGIEKNMKLTAPPITGTNQGSENIPRAPRSLKETTDIFRRQRYRTRLVRRYLRRSLRRDARLGVAAVAGRGDRLGVEAVLRGDLTGMTDPLRISATYRLRVPAGDGNHRAQQLALEQSIEMLATSVTDSARARHDCRARGRT